MAESDLALYDHEHLLDHLTTKQRRILSAAIDVFAELGYANASTKLVAQRAGVAEGNLFAKFKNKAGLLDAILQPVMTAIVPKIFTDFVNANFMGSVEHLEDLIRPLVQDRLNFVMANSKVLKLLFSEVAYSQARRDQLAQVIPQAQYAAIHQRLADLQQRGELVTWPDSAILQTLWSLLGGAAVNYLFFQQLPNSERLIQSLLKCLTPARD